MARPDVGFRGFVGPAMTIERYFTVMASRIASWSGSPAAFGVALFAVAAWAILGPVVHYSELWQLAINTGTTIITFLMVFIIQNSQNRDTRALQIKIDELILATKGASNSLIDLENSSAAELEELHKRYCEIAARAKALGYDFDVESPLAKGGAQATPILAKASGQKWTKSAGRVRKSIAVPDG
jgi:low affinity Fe/Cu permease